MTDIWKLAYKLDLSNTTILLTGGTGSFGTAFVQRVREEWPSATIRIYSRDELKQYEMRTRFGEEGLRYLLGDVRDRNRLYRAAQGADIIVHAAALKQVPACEYNPFEAIQTNVVGAQNVVDAAIDAGVGQVVGISTDKAVNPVNIYGATKLCAEKVMIQGNAYAARSSSRISCVRYGNVLASRGSVVHVFTSQRETGNITLTDRRMTRFFITLDQALDLVFFALDQQIGGEVFVPRIPSMKVVDLAEVLAPGVPITEIGIRPGEKLHELLVTSDEARHAVAAGLVFVIMPEHPWWESGGKWESEGILPDGYAFSSDTNERWISREDLEEMLEPHHT